MTALLVHSSFSVELSIGVNMKHVSMKIYNCTCFILFIFCGCTFNSFMPNGFPHLYQLDKSISNIRLLGDNFHLYSNLDRTFCKQTVKTLIERPKIPNRSICINGLKVYKGYRLEANNIPKNCKIRVEVFRALLAVV